jgi:hypothetical protein
MLFVTLFRYKALSPLKGRITMMKAQEAAKIVRDAMRAAPRTALLAFTGEVIPALVEERPTCGAVFAACLTRDLPDHSVMLKNELLKAVGALSEASDEDFGPALVAFGDHLGQKHEGLRGKNGERIELEDVEALRRHWIPRLHMWFGPISSKLEEACKAIFDAAFNAVRDGLQKARENANVAKATGGTKAGCPFHKASAGVPST